MVDEGAGGAGGDEEPEEGVGTGGAEDDREAAGPGGAVAIHVAEVAEHHIKHKESPAPAGGKQQRDANREALEKDRRHDDGGDDDQGGEEGFYHRDVLETGAEEGKRVAEGDGNGEGGEDEKGGIAEPDRPAKEHGGAGGS